MPKQHASALAVIARIRAHAVVARGETAAGLLALVSTGAAVNRVVATCTARTCAT
jgi:hypothetical protein